MKRILSLVLAAALLLSLACAAGEEKDTAQYWRETLQHYRYDDSVQQLLFVRCTGGRSAVSQFYVKLPEENNAWTLVFTDDSYIGKNGLGKTKEGDAMTPIGDFGIRTAFGIRNDPGTALPYLSITPSIFACDEECEFYNQIIDTAAIDHSCTGEEMYKYSPEYNYGIETDFNPDNQLGLGSAIFVHCKGAKPFTGGCVALDEDHMRIVLQMAQPGMRIVINEN